ncbi:hypothetical protein C6P64_13660 [Malikia granosa]|uniref:Glycosyltransferase n=2 Tax=Malikia granosa TaxID=263067 RepID=A0A2S9K2B9_9BURK|nr:hypothetical protein C6P64_13660 [Malikia granosa]
MCAISKNKAWWRICACCSRPSRLSSPDGGPIDMAPRSVPAAITMRKIRLTQADALLVGVGAPRQERWIQAHAAATGTTVVVGVGGLFDYYAGNIARAPLWMRRSGLEWLFRLLQEPRRLARRYLVGNWVFMMRVIGDRLRGNIRGKS